MSARRDLKIRLLGDLLDVLCFRGSSCAVPINTLAAYQLAVDDGADFLTVTVVSG